jgi:hypothetical protein
MSKIIKEKMDRESIQEGESFWVLRRPGTNDTIMTIENGRPVGPITFKSREDAVTFSFRYKVVGFEPEFITIAK